MNLQDQFNKSKKEDIYNFYTKIITTPKAYANISRQEMYRYITKEYQNNPEVILKMSSVEEINILKSLLISNLPKKNNGYIEYILLENLKQNFLIFEDNSEYYIPEDILNYVKMAINLYDESEYSPKDLTDSIIIGLVRIYNVISLKDLDELLKKYNCFFNNLKYLANYLKNPKLIAIVNLTKYKNKQYVISKEFNYYKEVLAHNIEKFPRYLYTFEEVISIGKYKINLFNDQIIQLLTFLESHLEPKYVNYCLNSLIIYCGLDINNLKVLKSIANDITEIYENMNASLNYFPIWLYHGNTYQSLNMILAEEKESN